MGDYGKCKLTIGAGHIGKQIYLGNGQVSAGTTSSSKCSTFYPSVQDYAWLSSPIWDGFRIRVASWEGYSGYTIHSENGQVGGCYSEKAFRGGE